MPLSDHEQRLLEQMEQALSAEDPKLASALRGIDARTRQRRRAIAGVAVFVLGVAALFSSVIIPPLANSAGTMIAVALAGFLLMLLSAYYVARNLRHAGTSESGTPGAGGGTRPRGPVGVVGGTAGRSGTARPTRPGHGPMRRPRRRPHGRGGFMARMEERWRRRRQSGGF